MKYSSVLLSVLLAGCMHGAPESNESVDELDRREYPLPPPTEEVLEPEVDEEKEELDEEEVKEGEVIEPEVGEEEVIEEDTEESNPVEEEEVMEAPEPRMIMLHSSDWAFTPNLITVKQGEDITLHLMGIEGDHGIAIPGLGINQTMAQGEHSMVQIPTDTPGTYEFFCNVPCGVGHSDMRGTIVIEE